jgi:hypothetical protein
LVFPSSSAIEPLRLARLPEPFDDPDWLFEIKTMSSARSHSVIAAQSV